MAAAKVIPVAPHTGDVEEPKSEESNLLKRSDAGDIKIPLSTQVYNKLFRSDASKERVLKVLQLVVFFDFLGNSLMFANSAYLFYPSDDPGLSQNDHDRKVGVFYKDAKDLGLGQAAAQNVGSSLSTFASAIAGASAPWLARYIGRKNCFLMYTLGASVFYVVTFFSSDWSLLLYYCCRVSTGLLAGSMTLANAFVYEIYDDPQEAQKKSSSLMGLLALAIAVGPLVGSIVGTANLFYPFLVAAGLEVIAGFLVIMYVPNLKKKDPLERSATADLDPHAKVEKDLSESKIRFKKRNYKCAMATLWTARLFDRFGGNQMAHLVTLAMRSYDGFFFKHYSMIFLGYSVLIFIVIPVSMNLTKKLGLALMPCVTQTMCAIFTCGLAFAWLKSDSVAVYLVLFFSQAFFNMNAMLVVTPTVVGIVPAEVKDIWLGYQSAAGNIMSGVVPLIMGLLIDAEECDKSRCGALAQSGSIPQGTFLFVTAGFGLLSVIPYASLLSIFPKPKPAKAEKSAQEEHDEKEVAAFWEDKDPTHMRFVSMEKRTAVNRKLMAETGELLKIPWRTYAEDKAAGDIPRYAEIGQLDQAFLLDHWEQQIYEFETADEKKREELREVRRKTFAGASMRWTQEDKQQLGEWFAEYLDECGWIPPKFFPRWWKAMMMASFPKIAIGDRAAAHEEFIQNPVPTMRKMIQLTTHIMKLDKDMNQAAYEAGSRFTFSSFKPPNLF